MNWKRRRTHMLMRKRRCATFSMRWPYHRARTRSVPDSMWRPRRTSRCSWLSRWGLHFSAHCPLQMINETICIVLTQYRNTLDVDVDNIEIHIDIDIDRLHDTVSWMLLYNVWMIPCSTYDTFQGDVHVPQADFNSDTSLNDLSTERLVLSFCVYRRHFPSLTPVTH